MSTKYRNGREAKLGDLILWRNGDVNHNVGTVMRILHELAPWSNAPNLEFHSAILNYSVNSEHCYHFDDAWNAVEFLTVSDIRPTLDITLGQKLAKLEGWAVANNFTGLSLAACGIELKPDGTMVVTVPPLLGGHKESK